MARQRKREEEQHADPEVHSVAEGTVFIQKGGKSGQAASTSASRNGSAATATRQSSQNPKGQCLAVPSAFRLMKKRI